MKFSTIISTAFLTSSISSVSAFVNTSLVNKGLSTKLRSNAEGEVGDNPLPELKLETPPVPTLNGWTADASLPCYGLPGAVAPTGYFDPLGFAQFGISLTEIKRNRESEVMHGRVAMLATVGYFVGESFSGPFHLVGPANDQLQQIPSWAFVILSGAIAAAELKRARIGWQEPDFRTWNQTLWKLRENYYPGDIGFDPLNFKPKDAKAFASMQTRELQNGRLAMIGIAGMCSQELVNHRTILETFDFYNKVYHGVNPYALCGDAIIC